MSHTLTHTIGEAEHRIFFKPFSFEILGKVRDLYAQLDSHQSGGGNADLYDELFNAAVVDKPELAKVALLISGRVEGKINAGETLEEYKARRVAAVTAQLAEIDADDLREIMKIEKAVQAQIRERLFLDEQTIALCCTIFRTIVDPQKTDAGLYELIQADDLSNDFWSRAEADDIVNAVVFFRKGKRF